MRMNTADIDLLLDRISYNPESGLFLVKSSGRRAFATRHREGYLAGRFMGVLFLAHRVAWAMHHKRWPKRQIDHINGVRDDNRIANLRDVSHIENHRNCRPWNPQKSQCPPGVYKNHGKYSARIKVNYVTHYLGSFATEEQAHAAYLRAKEQHGFHRNHGKVLP